MLSVIIAFPLALVARRLPRLQGAILGTSTAIYTIPSLALFPLLVPFTGITATTVVIGLALYALTILVRSMLSGLAGVPDEVRESAIGLGYGAGRLLFRIELPLALPVMMAGLRVATVSTVALTTVGTLVSYGGLGNLIEDGVQNNFKAELLAASVLCVVLAFVARRPDRRRAVDRSPRGRGGRAMRIVNETWDYLTTGVQLDRAPTASGRCWCSSS